MATSTFTKNVVVTSSVETVAAFADAIDDFKYDYEADEMFKNRLTPDQIMERFNYVQSKKRA